MTTSLTLGQRLEQALFLPTGQKLLSAESVISARHLKAIGKLPNSLLYMADCYEDLIYHGLIKDRGHDVDSHADGLLEALPEDAVDGGPASSDDPLIKLRRQRMKSARERVALVEDQLESICLRVEPAEHNIWHDQPPHEEQWPEVEALSEARSFIVEDIQGLFRAVEVGQPVELAQVEAIVDSLYSDLLLHRERFPQLALLCKRRENYVGDHVLCVTVLSMATAAQLHWPEEEVRQMGLIGLLFDLGMLLIPERIRIGTSQLSDIDRNAVDRHTAYSVSMIDHIKGVDPLVKLAAFQHHERENGFGYPRGIRGAHICDQAKILAATDVFCAATSPRAYHKAKLPYTIMEEIIRSAAAGIFNKVVVKALVQAAGLFPVGSWAVLSNQRLGKILACNPDRLDRPLVDVHEYDGQPVGHQIDLAQVPPERLSIVRPSPSPEQMAMAG